MPRTHKVNFRRAIVTVIAVVAVGAASTAGARPIGDPPTSVKRIQPLKTTRYDGLHALFRLPCLQRGRGEDGVTDGSAAAPSAGRDPSEMPAPAGARISLSRCRCRRNPAGGPDRPRKRPPGRARAPARVAHRMPARGRLLC